jgi:DNA-binding transcriptional LysR family regulator
MMPSPADLTYFIAVAELQNLSRAAERLNISQPSLTLAMRRLEDSMGTPLLIRHKRGVSLTKAGKQLQTYARHLLQQWEMVKTETLASVHDVQGSFTIGCHPSVALYSLPRFLPKLMAEHPKLNIKLKHDLSRHITEQVINLSVDIGIVVNPARHADLVIKKIANDKITLWQSKHRAGPITPDTILICDPELVQTQVILKKLKKQGIEFNRVMPTSSLEVIADLTEAGNGIGILPGNIAKLHQVTAVAKAPFYDDDICLIYHGQNRDVKALQVIADAIKKAFS